MGNRNSRQRHTKPNSTSKLTTRRTRLRTTAPTTTTFTKRKTVDQQERLSSHSNMDPTKGDVNLENIKPLISKIKELTSANDFDVSTELCELLSDLLAVSEVDMSENNNQLITTINSLNSAYILVRIVSILSGRGTLSQESEQCLRTTYYCIYNLSDKREFARSAANTCIITKCMENLKAKEKYISEDQSDKNSLDVIDYSLGIIYNISKEENIESLFDNDMSILQIYTKSENEDFVAMSVMILVHLSNGEAEKIQDEKETTVYLIRLLQRATNEEDRRAIGYSSTELIEGLARLALNDNNKLTVAEEGGISLLMKLVLSHREEEQVAAAQCLWTLAFLDSIQKDLQPRKEKLQALSKSCHNKVLRKSLEGILLTIAKSDGTTKGRARRKYDRVHVPILNTDKNCEDGHIMISYAWDGGYGQIAATKIAANLKSRGLKVWIDTDEMKGSFLDAMAQAVNDSYAFVLCASDKYRTSNNCRLEASSAHLQHKLIIPVVVGSSIHSKNDWLMLLCADKLYVDFTDESKFHLKCKELVQQIVRLSKEVDHMDAVAENVRGTTSPPKAIGSVAKWSPCDVKKWLRDQALQCFEDEFEDFDGRALIRLKKIQSDAPEFFYRYFCERTDGREKRKLIDVLRLIEAIESLML
ncbi:hypothetical protein HOLleu_06362 [Holothuria leucospilota]|uniref:TIR domain-containing protein n=1 Tax=Holothuria leucospilota TaxID=206669 RepID=A0A9Q1CMC3_HOLLE|nr:hypothetical protein HOLleu_06362 [Holothuria leucospilota]